MSQDNEKVSEQPMGYFEAEVAKIEKDGVAIVLRRSYEMNGQRQPAAIEIIEAKKPVRVVTKQAARVIAELSRKKIFQDFADQHLGEIQKLDSLDDA